MGNNERRVEGLARRLDSHGIDVLALLPGANFTYYTGLSKGLSERPTVAFFSTNRRPAFIVPSFELSATKQLLSYDVVFLPTPMRRDMKERSSVPAIPWNWPVNRSG